MADREIIAATLAAGLLPPAPLPLDPSAPDWNDLIDRQDEMAERAIELYRLVLGKLVAASLP